MRLTSAQLEQLDRDGYLFFPRQFSVEEMKVLTDEVPVLYAQRRLENVREKGSDAVRTNFAAHMYSAPFARLARQPVVQVFGEPVYMHQFKMAHGAVPRSVTGRERSSPMARPPEMKADIARVKAQLSAAPAQRNPR